MCARFLLTLVAAISLGCFGQMVAADSSLQCWATQEVDGLDTTQKCGAERGFEALVENVQYMCPYGTGFYCVTPYGSCQLYQPLCVGSPCYCPSVYGPVWGNVN